MGFNLAKAAAVIVILSFILSSCSDPQLEFPKSTPKPPTATPVPEEVFDSCVYKNPSQPNSPYRKPDWEEAEITKYSTSKESDFDAWCSPAAGDCLTSIEEIEDFYRERITELNKATEDDKTRERIKEVQYILQCIDDAGWCCLPRSHMGFYESVRCEGYGIMDDGKICSGVPSTPNFIGESQESSNCMEDRTYSRGRVAWPEFGITPTAKRTIAVDRTLIPLGSLVYVDFGEGYEEWNGCFRAEDTGSAIKGRHIDVFVGVGTDLMQDTKLPYAAKVWVGDNGCTDQHLRDFGGRDMNCEVEDIDTEVSDSGNAYFAPGRDCYCLIRSNTYDISDVFPCSTSEQVYRCQIDTVYPAKLNDNEDWVKCNLMLPSNAGLAFCDGYVNAERRECGICPGEVEYRKSKEAGEVPGLSPYSACKGDCQYSVAGEDFTCTENSADWIWWNDEDKEDVIYNNGDEFSDCNSALIVYENVCRCP